MAFFWVGFLLYTGSFALSTTTTVSYIMCQAVQAVGILIFVPATIKLISWKFSNLYLQVVFTLFALWQVTILLRFSHLDYTTIKEQLFDAELGMFRFFVPLVLLFPKNLLYYEKLIRAVVVLGILFLLYDVLFSGNLLNMDYENTNTKFTYEHFVKILSAPAGLILLTYRYQDKRVKYFAIVVLLVSAIFAVIRARRALLMLTISPLLISYLIYLYTRERKFFSKLAQMIVISGLLIFVGMGDYFTRLPKIFEFFSERVTEDTRSGVEMFFYRDMTTKDWIIGKGIDGEYFCPGIETGTHSIYRAMIETDYLNIILKGGLVSLILLLMIAVPAVVKGLFFSRNNLSKVAAVWILMWIIELYPATVTTFSLHYISVWLAIGLCYSDNIRNASEESIDQIFSELRAKPQKMFFLF